MAAISDWDMEISLKMKNTSRGKPAEDAGVGIQRRWVWTAEALISKHCDADGWGKGAGEKESTLTTLYNIGNTQVIT